MERRERRRRVRFSLEHFPVLNYATHMSKEREGSIEGLGSRTPPPGTIV